MNRHHRLLALGGIASALGMLACAGPVEADTQTQTNTTNLEPEPESEQKPESRQARRLRERLLVKGRTI